MARFTEHSRQSVTRTGKIQKSENNIILAMEKKKEGDDEKAKYFMHAYIVSDARIITENKELKSSDL